METASDEGALLPSMRVYRTFILVASTYIYLPSCIELMSKSMTSYPLTYGALGIRFAVPLTHGG